MTTYFNDGSELWSKFTDTFTNNGRGGVTQKGTATVIGGKGRYAGAKGDGTWEGETPSQSVLLSGDGGGSISYIDNVINIKK
jgi:hypothetical protein